MEEAYAHFRLDRQALPVSPATLCLHAGQRMAERRVTEEDIAQVWLH